MNHMLRSTIRYKSKRLVSSVPQHRCFPSPVDELYRFSPAPKELGGAVAHDMAPKEMGGSTVSRNSVSREMGASDEKKREMKLTRQIWNGERLAH